MQATGNKLHLKNARKALPLTHNHEQRDAAQKMPDTSYWKQMEVTSPPCGFELKPLNE